MDLSKVFAGVVLAAGQAETVAEKAIFYIRTVEQTVSSIGAAKSGSEKLAAVKAALLADLALVDADLAKKVEGSWPAVSAVISGLVTIYHALGAFGFVLKLV